MALRGKVRWVINRSFSSWKGGDKKLDGLLMTQKDNTDENNNGGVLSSSDYSVPIFMAPYQERKYYKDGL